jgi:Xaa-Pro aminopeptidase
VKGHIKSRKSSFRPTKNRISLLLSIYLMDLRARIEAVRRRMSADGLDLLIAASTGLHTLDRPDPVAYLTGYRSVGESIFLLHSSGDATLIVSPAADAERLTSRYNASTALATDDIVGTVEKILTGHPALTIGTVNLNSLPYRLAEQLLSLCAAAARPFDEILYTIAGRKTNLEIERARTAAAIAEKGFARLLQLARPGLRECDLAVETNAFTKSLGAEDNFLMLNSLPHSHAVMPSSTRPIEPGDILLTELSPNFDGQFSQICRTVSIGAPRRELQEKYDLVVRAMWAGIEAVRPGVPVSEVCRAIDRVLESAGYAEYCRPPHMRRRGHGLGSGSVSPGDISVDNHTILEENMIFVVHPNQYIPQVGYLLCGEPVRVTATGVEVLSSRTAALGVVAAGHPGFVPCA